MRRGSAGGILALSNNRPHLNENDSHLEAGGGVGGGVGGAWQCPRYSLRPPWRLATLISRLTNALAYLSIKTRSGSH